MKLCEPPNEAQADKRTGAGQRSANTHTHAYAAADTHTKKPHQKYSSEALGYMHSLDNIDFCPE